MIVTDIAKNIQVMPLKWAFLISKSVVSSMEVLPKLIKNEFVGTI